MACKTQCQLCQHLVLSQAVTFANGTLTINLPAGAYNNGEKYCIVVAQAIPAAVTRDAPVVITIGDGATTYPLTDRCCVQAVEQDINSRTKYSTCVVTNANGGTFRYLGRWCHTRSNALASLNGGAAAEAQA